MGYYKIDSFITESTLKFFKLQSERRLKYRLFWKDMKKNLVLENILRFQKLDLFCVSMSRMLKAREKSPGSGPSV